MCLQYVINSTSGLALLGLNWPSWTWLTAAARASQWYCTIYKQGILVLPTLSSSIYTISGDMFYSFSCIWFIHMECVSENIGLYIHAVAKTPLYLFFEKINRVYDLCRVARPVDIAFLSFFLMHSFYLHCCYFDVRTGSRIRRVQASHAEDWEFDSKSIETNDLQNWYLSLPSLVLSINSLLRSRTGQLSIRIM